MAKVKISEFSSTPANNTDIDGINLAEGCAPSGINDAIRELMSQLKDFQTGAVGDSFNGPVGTTTAAAGAFTTLSASSTVTLSGGTANGVPYLNGSKVLTTGSALTFDGTNLSNSGNYIGTAAVGRLTKSNTTGRNLLTGGVTGGITDGAYIITEGYDYGGAAAGGAIQLVTAGATSPITMLINGSEQMRLTSTGLGIGVTPSAWVTTSGRKAIEVGALGNALFGAGTSDISLFSNAYINASAQFTYANNGLAARYQIPDGSHRWYIAPSGTAGNAITFTQAMTLDASGNLLVAVTSSAATNNTEGFRVISGGVPTVQRGVDGGFALFYNKANSSTIGSITNSGGVATLFNTTSDQRLKENIQDAAPTSALIDSLQVRQYDWKAGGSHQRYGFIAQELVTVAPEAVHQPADPDDMMAVDYSKLVPMLVKEIQSLRQRLAALEAA